PPWRHHRKRIRTPCLSRRTLPHVLEKTGHMKQSLQLRASQHLALTPHLQQSIRLLQLSTLELHQELEQILAENPMLERTDDPLDHATRLLTDGAIKTSAITAAPTDDTPAPAAVENTSSTDIDNTP